jgi:beta-galactosidase
MFRLGFRVIFDCIDSIQVGSVLSGTMSNKTLGSRCVSFFAAFSAAVLFSSCVSNHVTDPGDGPPLRDHTLLDAGWKFHRGDIESNEMDHVIAAEYGDQSWQEVHLPHDYVLDGTYASNYDRGHGYLPYPVAWYRKHFAIDETEHGKTLELEFGGIFRDSKIWLNGQFLGEHKSGYTSFFYDITKIAKVGGENVLTVRVDPHEFEGWWYEGGGIYRHVYLNAYQPLHVAPWGTYAASFVPRGNEGADDMAEVVIRTTVKNDSPDQTDCGVVSEIVAPNGTLLKTLRSDQVVPGVGQKEFVQHAELSRPHLWSPESPALYQLRTRIMRGARPMDSTTTTFGIRTTYYDPDKGFFLNGKHVKICGVALHQDFPAVGIATPDSLQPWRVMQLKQMGCNGWRTAHNPPTESVLDACDRLGMLVMDENRHLGYTYHHHSSTNVRDFPGFLTNYDDLADMIQRDRNHPSIIMWSMCNEEPLQGTRHGAEIFTNMMAVVHKYDRTRPITSAMHAGQTSPEGDAWVEDLIGVNYSYPRYDAIHRKHPDKPMFGSEMSNEKTARYVYAENKKKGWATSYNLSESSYQPTATNEYMSGSYTWTGFDYRGEPNPFGWPDVSNNTGLMDMCGFPKDKYYYMQSCWAVKPMVHLLPMRWNWAGKEGKPIRVLAFSNAGEVELFLNGKSLGRKPVPRYGHAEWNVPYEPGRLEAKAFDGGRMVASDLVETVGAPARLVMTCDWKSLQANGEDTAVAPVSIVDAKGRLVMTAENRVSFQVDGAAAIVGVGNGNPSDHDPERADRRNAFNGHCLAVIRAGEHAGTVRVTASSPGLKPATITLALH